MKEKTITLKRTNDLRYLYHLEDWNKGCYILKNNLYLIFTFMVIGSDVRDLRRMRRNFQNLIVYFISVFLKVKSEKKNTQVSKNPTKSMSNRRSKKEIKIKF